MKKCILVVNKYKESAVLLAKKVIQFLSSNGIGCKEFFFSGDERVPSFEGCDFAVTLGGDGTVLLAARKCAPLKIPVFPINFGEFGFIAGIDRNEWEEKLKLFLQDELLIAERSLIQIEVFRNKRRVFSSLALNDAVIKSAGRRVQLADLKVSCNDQDFGKFRADGIIVSTPTGSTAYSAASGGPIVDPSLDAIIFNPICALSLSNRPIVLSSESVLSVEIMESRGADIVLSCDGQAAFALKADDSVKIARSQNKALLAGCGNDVFYTALRSKLGWSGGPHG